MPTERGLADMLQWPFFEPQKLSREWRLYAEKINHMPKVIVQDGRTYVDMPHPDNFTLCPPVAEALWGWTPPEGLNRVAEGLRHKGPSRRI